MGRNVIHRNSRRYYRNPNTNSSPIALILTLSKFHLKVLQHYLRDKSLWLFAALTQSKPSANPKLTRSRYYQRILHESNLSKFVDPEEVHSSTSIH